VIFKVSNKEKIIIFAEGYSLSKNKSNQESEYYDVIMVYFLERRGKDSTNFYVAHLVPEGLKISPIIELNERKKIKVSDLEKEPQKLAAALVSKKLFGHIATQLYREAQWKNKIHRLYR